MSIYQGISYNEEIRKNCVADAPDFVGMKSFENIDHLHYVSIDGPAVQTVDADGKIINKMYVVNGIKLNEFEFEVFKASGKKNFYSRGAN